MAASFTLKNLHDLLLASAEVELGTGIVSRVHVELRGNPSGAPTLEATIILKRKPKFGVPLEKISGLTDVLRDALGADADNVEPYVRFLTEAELMSEARDD